MPLKADPSTAQVKRKGDKIDEIRGKFADADAALLTEYRGLTVTEIATLRGELRPAGAEYKVYKNTLVRRAVDEIGLAEHVADMLAGPVAIAFVKGDAAAAAKALREYAKGNPNLVLKGGVLARSPLSPSDIESLADLPPKETLLSQIAGLFEAPLSQTAGLLEALLRDTVGLVQALVDKRGGEPAESAATESGETEAPAAEAPAVEADAEAPAEAAAEAAEASEEAPAEAATEETEPTADGDAG
jgi:large subunit ribosomal protein L10